MRRVVLGLIPLALLALSCGQVGDARRTTIPRTGAAAVGGVPAPVGQEGSGAPVTYQITVMRLTKSRNPTVELTKLKLPKVRWPNVDPANPLRICPVFGPGHFGNDFGAPRYAGGYHPHAGNDMFAPAGTRILAPFDGVAVRTPNTLGGLAVKVYGPLGYVYNAHLSAYGKVGRVKAGDVIGFVGNTGDAVGTPPHNHFEWHPGNGPAVNPFPYLMDVCHGG